MVENSPVKGFRFCTDIPCLVLFIAFIIGWIVVAVLAARAGSIKRFTMPSDSSGHICGVDKGYEKKKYLLFFDLTKCVTSDALLFGCPTPQMCVEKCPSTYFYGALPHLGKNVTLSEANEDKLKKRLQYCLPSVDYNMSYTRLADGYHCAAWYVPSEPVGKRCIPRLLAQTVHHLGNISRNLHRNVTKTEHRAMMQLELESRKGGKTKKPIHVSSTSNSTDSNSTRTRPTRPTTENPLAPFLNGTGDFLPKTSDGTNITKSVIKRARTVVASIQFVVAHFSLLTVLSLLLPLLLSLLFILLLRCLVGPVIWTGLLGAVLALVVVAAICGSHYSEIKHSPAANRTLKEVGFTRDTKQYTQLSSLWLALTIVAAVIALLLLIIIIALRRKIMMTVALLKQCSAAVRDMVTLPLVPVISFTLQLAVLMFFMLVVLTLFGSVRQWRVKGDCTKCDAYATGDLCYPQDFIRHCQRKCPKAFCLSTAQFDLHGYNIFAVVWSLGFVSVLNQIALAMAFCTWYFSRSKMLSFALPFTSYLRTVAFHTGTAAFGSLLVTICKIVRCLMQYVKRKLEKRVGVLASCCMCCCTCCCWCLEKFIKFMNRRAYIVTALEGCGLCAGARRGMEVVMKNVAMVAVADSITWLVLGAGKLVVVVSSVIICHFCIGLFTGGDAPWLLPAIYCAILSWIVCSSTFAVYDMGVDVLFYCVMVDLDINDGSPERPYMMSSGMAFALGVTNKPAPPPPQPPPISVPRGSTPQPPRASMLPPMQPYQQPYSRAPTPMSFQDPGMVDLH